MTGIELKEKLIAQINRIDDEHMLDDISRNIDLKLELNNGTYVMSAAEIEAVEEGLEQLRTGQWITHEEANKHVEEWLKKYDGQ